MCIITDDITKKQCSSHQRMKVLSTYKRISLWLIPPEPLLTSLTQTQLQLIEFHDSRSNNMSSFLNNGKKTLDTAGIDIRFRNVMFTYATHNSP